MLDESRKLGNFAHGFTYAGHPVTTAVAMETLRIYEETDMIGHVQQVGPYMQQALRRISRSSAGGRGARRRHDVRHGAGARTKRPARAFDPARRSAPWRSGYAREHGLIARFIGDRIAFSPPLIITEAEIDDVAQRLRRALDATWAELRV